MFDRTEITKSVAEDVADIIDGYADGDRVEVDVWAGESVKIVDVETDRAVYFALGEVKWPGPVQHWNRTAEFIDGPPKVVVRKDDSAPDRLAKAAFRMLELFKVD